MDYLVTAPVETWTEVAVEAPEGSSREELIKLAKASSLWEHSTDEVIAPESKWTVEIQDSGEEVK